MELKYKKMLSKMKEKEETYGVDKKAEPWFLYMLRCSDGSLYTGVTNNLERRLTMHNKGTASRYTRTRLPVEMLYHETCASRTQAMVRECAVKAFSRKQKDELIRAMQS